MPERLLSPWRRLAGMVRDPVAWTELTQVLKTVLAAVVAWVIAAEMLELPQPFLAPWAALLVVHATVYRTLSRGVQQVGATVVGVVLAWAVGSTLGLTPTALAVMLFLGLLVGLLPGQRAEATTAAATALIVLTTGFSDQDQVLLARLYDTAIGIVVGLLVNVLVWPPFWDRAAARSIDVIDDQIGGLLHEIAGGLRAGHSEKDAEAWIERTREIDVLIDRAWALVSESRESGRLNPRRSSGGVRLRSGFGDLLDGMEQAVAETRSMARTLKLSISDVKEWDEEFRRRWVGMLEETGAAIIATDSGRVGGVRVELTDLADEFSTENLPGLHWTEYGGLILNLRNIAMAMQDVAAAQPVTPGRNPRRWVVRG